MREGLRALLEKQPDFQVVAEAQDGRVAVEAARDVPCDVIIMDIGMPDLNGIEATHQILAHAPQTKILALSMHADKRFITAMLKAGASGYLLKSCAARELTRALKTICQGQTYLSPALATLLVQEFVQNPDPQPSPSALLTPREREVLQQLAEGKSTKMIAALLHVSISTVETHRRQIMDKLNIHNIADLTKFAIKEGLTFLDI